eukprot:2062764-Pleurochrysis_carterae.AAC.1
MTESGRRVATGSARFRRSIEWTNELNKATLGSAMPRTSKAWIIEEMVAFVAFDVARASMASMRSSSRPLPAQDAV